MKESPSLSGLAFDDVLLRPGKAGVHPSDVSLKSEIFRGFTSALPIIPAPMNSVFSLPLARVLSSLGLATPLPREISDFELNRLLVNRHLCPLVATTSPFREEEVWRLTSDSRIDYIILDSVVAYNDRVLKLLDSLQPALHRKLIVGNIATREAAAEFSKYELGGIKVGLGAGSICTTSLVTGVGVPQLQAISEVSQELSSTSIPVIADGGIRSPGDIAKAIAAGAAGVMLGRYFAATSEAGDGELIELDGNTYKRYEAAYYATLEGNAGSSDRDRLSSHRAEGVSGLVLHSGPAKLLIEHLSRCLSAAVAFTGASDLLSFRRNAVFQQISAAAQRQVGHHGIELITQCDRITGGADNGPENF